MPNLTTATPETISSILARAPAKQKETHEWFVTRGTIKLPDLGTVFFNNAGDLCVYTGLHSTDNKKPICYVRVHDRASYHAPQGLLARVRAGV